MSQFEFHWDAPSSIWLRCDQCSELIEVNYRDTIHDVEQRTERHTCDDSEPRIR